MSYDDVAVEGVNPRTLLRLILMVRSFALAVHELPAWLLTV
jgi:hypothetical protein